jgi:Tfp pilus assembly protein PilV
MTFHKGATLVGSLIAVTILITTFVSALNLQASIIKTKFFLRHDNTANLLAAEGIEIVRAQYITDKDSISNGRYAIDYTTAQKIKDLPTTLCSNTNVVNSCALDNTNYTLNSGANIFYRFINITITTDIIVSKNIVTVDSIVIVKNPRGASKQYKVSSTLYEL